MTEVDSIKHDYNLLLSLIYIKAIFYFASIRTAKGDASSLEQFLNSFLLAMNLCYASLVLLQEGFYHHRFYFVPG